MSDHEENVIESIQRKLARIELLLGQHTKALITLFKMEKSIMAALTDLQAKAASEGQSLDALTTAIAAIPTGGTGGGLSAADQAIVDSTFAEMTNNDAKIAAAQAAVAALTPTAPAAKKA